MFGFFSGGVMRPVTIAALALFYDESVLQFSRVSNSCNIFIFLVKYSSVLLITKQATPEAVFYICMCNICYLLHGKNERAGSKFHSGEYFVMCCSGDILSSSYISDAEEVVQQNEFL